MSLKEEIEIQEKEFWERKHYRNNRYFNKEERDLWQNEKKESKFKRLLRDIVKYFREYCRLSGIHGVQYIGEERSTFEIIWWTIIFLISLIGCLYMISGIYLKWLQSPVLVSFSAINTPIYQIPFPAVTICPKNKINKASPTCFNYTDFVIRKKIGEKVTEREKLYSDYMQILCGDWNMEEDDGTIIDAGDFYNFISSCHSQIEIFTRFNGKHFNFNFEEFFKQTYTEEGLCYTFNRLRLDEIYEDFVVRYENNTNDFNQSEWNSENGYNDDAGMNSYPRRALLPTIKYGLGIILSEDKRNTEYYCDPILQGYTITLHLPGSIPHTKEEYFFLPLNGAIIAPIEISMILTSERVKAYPPHKRNCYFPNERKLKYFKTYSKQNCELECITDNVLENCQCVKFYMPRKNSTPVCGIAKRKCAETTERFSRTSSAYKELEGQEKGKRKQYSIKKCKCLAMCTEIKYTADIGPLYVEESSLIDWAIRMEFNGFQEKFQNNTDLHSSVLMLYFKDSEIITTERSELYGPLDFLSNFGGLLGLFTGFSILSCIEILYFLTLRIMCNVKLFGRWTGQN